MGWFKREKKTEAVDTRIASVVRASGDAIATVQAAGRYPLSLVVIGGAVVIVSLILYRFVDAVANLFPWLFGFAAFLAVLGVVVYALDSRNRQKLIQQSLDQYHDLVRQAFLKYLESFDKIDGYQLDGIIAKLDSVYRTSIGSVNEAQQKDAPDRVQHAERASKSG